MAKILRSINGIVRGKRPKAVQIVEAQKQIRETFAVRKSVMESETLKDLDIHQLKNLRRAENREITALAKGSDRKSAVC